MANELTKPGSDTRMTRRTLTLGLAATGLAGCAKTQTSIIAGDLPAPDPASALYGPLPNEQFPIAAVNLSRLPAKFHRQKVNYETTEQPGTVIVDTRTKYLYLVRDGGTAMRYGIGIGRQCFSWAGRASIDNKKRWPTWTPPTEMIEREPDLAQYADGMAPGLENPLGARALYLFQNGQDTLYRIHGTLEVDSIGNAVSSGCIRLLNQDIIDLYNRVALGAEVVVQGHEGQAVHSHVV